ncbi:ribonuclease H-like domain-containing protein [Pisolithus tinctorius]|uniref:Ribonuclease n=1 Tax=Pisolithus tinctorius Marx 270 TaxID=870435 RepID=A0A0C3PKX0_PISTI|nr:ribonuclease H-like domain-containing protein [Pisolithus tinctorius]KIO14895.1 hypothetical protein M404DRAFT_17749 [Pisolithus tinctorius Marx 270]
MSNQSHPEVQEHHQEVQEIEHDVRAEIIQICRDMITLLEQLRQDINVNRVETGAAEVTSTTETGVREQASQKQWLRENLIVPLTESYTHHGPTPTAPGPYVLGVDEADRGRVLGPLVHGVAYCLDSWKAELEKLGFADSKTLIPSKGTELPLDLPEESGPHFPGCNSDPSTDSKTLIPSKGTELPLDLPEESGPSLGNIQWYAKGSSDEFEQAITSGAYNYQSCTLLCVLQTASGWISHCAGFTVTQKADSKFKIVGAASVATNMTRDACIELWTLEELQNITAGPKTQERMKDALHPTFGFPSMLRFSWTTAKDMLNKSAHPVKWIDGSGRGRDKDRIIVAKDLCLHSVGVM